jgi:hypothetical protein
VPATLILAGLGRHCSTRQFTPLPPKLLDRQFEATGPNQKWAADFTYFWTGEGWLFVAVVLDLYSRRVVGWSMEPTMTVQLVMVQDRIVVGETLVVAHVIESFKQEMLDFRMRSVMADSRCPAARSARTYSPNTLCSGLSRLTSMLCGSQAIRMNLMTNVCRRSRAPSGWFFSIASRTC